MTETTDSITIKQKKHDKSIMMDDLTISIVENARNANESFSACVCRLIQSTLKPNIPDHDINGKLDEILSLIRPTPVREITNPIKPIEDQLLELLNEPMNEYEIASFLNLDALEVRTLINKQLGLTKIKKIGRNQYVRR